MTHDPPTGARFVRVLRTMHHAEPYCHPTNPMLDGWNSWDTTKVLFVREDKVDPKTDKLVDLS